MKPRTVEHYYPTRPAREAADEHVDTLPGATSLDDACREWLRVYAEHGGAVRSREKGDRGR